MRWRLFGAKSTSLSVIGSRSLYIYIIYIGIMYLREVRSCMYVYRSHPLGEGFSRDLRLVCTAVDRGGVGLYARWRRRPSTQSIWLMVYAILYAVCLTEDIKLKAPRGSRFRVVDSSFSPKCCGTTPRWQRMLRRKATVAGKGWHGESRGDEVCF